MIEYCDFVSTLKSYFAETLWSLSLNFFGIKQIIVMPDSRNQSFGRNEQKLMNWEKGKRKLRRETTGRDIINREPPCALIYCTKLCYTEHALVSSGIDGHDRKCRRFLSYFARSAFLRRCFSRCSYETRRESLTSTFLSILITKERR